MKTTLPLPDGPQRIVWSHGEIITDRHNRQVEALFADQLHIAKQAGVAGQIDFLAVCSKQEAGGIATIRSVRQT